MAYILPTMTEGERLATRIGRAAGTEEAEARYAEHDFPEGADAAAVMQHFHDFEDWPDDWQPDPTYSLPAPSAPHERDLYLRAARIAFEGRLESLLIGDVSE